MAADDDVQIKVGVTTDDLDAGISKVVSAIEGLQSPAQSASEEVSKLGEAIAGIQASAEAGSSGLSQVVAAISALQSPVETVVTMLGGPELGAAFHVFEGLVDDVVGVTKEMTDLGLQTERTMVILGTSAEQVGKLGFVAQASGNSIETVGIVMARLAFNLEKAAKSASPVNDSLQALGLNARQLLAMDLDHRIIAISDAFHNAADSSGKTAAAIQLLGRTAVSLLPMLNKGSEAYNELSDVAERAGIVLSGPMVDAFEQTRLKVIEFNDALKTGVTITLFSMFEPAIDAAADIMNRLLEAFNQGVKSGGAFYDVLNSVAFVAKTLVGTLGATIAVLEKLFAIVNVIDETMTTLSEGGSVKISEKWAELNKIWGDSDAALKRIEDDLNGVAGAEGKKGAGNDVNPADIAAARERQAAEIKLAQDGEAIKLAMEVETINAKKALNEISIAEQYSELQAATAADFKIKMDALNQERNANLGNEKQLTAIDKRIAVAELQNRADVQKLNIALNAANQAQEDTLNNQEISNALKLAQIKLQATTAQINTDFALHKINVMQKSALLKNALADDLKAEKTYYTEKEKLDDGDVVKVQEDELKKTQAVQENLLKQAEVTDAALKAQEAIYQKYFDFVEQQSHTVFADFLHGITSWHDEFRKIMQDTALFFASMIEKMVLKWAAGQLTDTAATVTSEATTTAAVVGGEAAKTGATVAGVAARTADEQAGAESSLSTIIGSILKVIEADAAAVFAGIFAFLSPILGPAAGVPAAAGESTVMAAGAGLSGEFSGAGSLSASQSLLPGETPVAYATGSWSVPHTESALVHQGEMILPAGMADGVRRGIGGGGGETHIHIHNPIGTREWFDANHEYIAGAMQKAARNAHPAFNGLGR